MSHIHHFIHSFIHQVVRLKQIIGPEAICQCPLLSVKSSCVACIGLLLMCSSMRGNHLLTCHDYLNELQGRDLSARSRVEQSLAGNYQNQRVPRSTPSLSVPSQRANSDTAASLHSNASQPAARAGTSSSCFAETHALALLLQGAALCPNIFPGKRPPLYAVFGGT